MKIFKNIYIAFLFLCLNIGIFLFSLYCYCLTGTSNDDTLKTIEIGPGSISSIAATLKEEGFIREELVFKLYVRLKDKSNLKAGVYSFSKDMGVAKIVEILEEGSTFSNDYIKILFKEGLNMRQIADVIASNTNNTQEMVYDLLEDKEYLNKVINDYWFIDDSILNDKIYYPLEGYLYPSTYYFDSEDVNVETIFKSMLDEMGKQLEEYKDVIEDSGYSIHEILTLASIVELEGISFDDRKKIAGVFYNRLKKKDTLGSDVTTYYGYKVNIGEVKDKDLNFYVCNDYNTRCLTFKSLPVSAICSPSLDAIKATLEPDYTYYYFLADKHKKIYFSNTEKQHINTRNKLKREGLWWE